LEKNLYFPYDGTTNADLNTLLTHIFTAVRTKEGKVCCRSVMAYRNISRKCWKLTLWICQSLMVLIMVFCCHISHYNEIVIFIKNKVTFLNVP
jgi:hypothetical protein